MSSDREKLQMLEALVGAWFATLREASADYGKLHHAETLRYAAVEVNRILCAPAAAPSPEPDEISRRCRCPDEVVIPFSAEAVWLRGTRHTLLQGCAAGTSENFPLDVTSPLAREARASVALDGETQHCNACRLEAGGTAFLGVNPHTCERASGKREHDPMSAGGFTIGTFCDVCRKDITTAPPGEACPGGAERAPSDSQLKQSDPYFSSGPETEIAERAEPERTCKHGRLLTRPDPRPVLACECCFTTRSLVHVDDETVLCEHCAAPRGGKGSAP